MALTKDTGEFKKLRNFRTDGRERQQKVLELMNKGLSLEQISLRLGISKNTVYNIRKKIRKEGLLDATKT